MPGKPDQPAEGEGLPEDVNPLSMPLEKGEDILTGAPSPFSRKTEASRGGGKHLHPVCHAPRTWVLFAAMFLFPFFFNLGSELYLLLRASVLPQHGVALTAPVPAPKVDISPDAIKTMSVILANQEKLIQEGQKVVIIHSEYPGSFSYEGEKRKILELCGFDIDDPVNLAERFSKIKSAEITAAVIESLDRIMINAAQYGVSELHVKNAIEVKKLALKRLQEIR